MTQYHSFSASAAARLAGITYRQIDYAVREEYFHPAVPAQGSGSRRRLSRENVLTLRAAKIISDELDLELPKALDHIPVDADLEGVIEIHTSERVTIVVDLHLEPEELEQFAAAA